MGTTRFLRNLITFLVIYYNVALLGTEICGRFELPCRAPLGFPLGAVFNVFPVFTHYLQDNSEVIVEGLPESTAGYEWIEMDCERYLPYGRGDKYNRLVGLLGHPVMSADRARWLAIVARKIREYHNRCNENRQIKAARLRMITWPRSIHGYSAMRNQDTETARLIYSEQPSEGEPYAAPMD